MARKSFKRSERAGLGKKILGAVGGTLLSHTTGVLASMASKKYGGALALATSTATAGATMLAANRKNMGETAQAVGSGSVLGVFTTLARLLTGYSRNDFVRDVGGLERALSAPSPGGTPAAQPGGTPAAQPGSSSTPAKSATDDTPAKSATDDSPGWWDEVTNMINQAKDQPAPGSSAPAKPKSTVYAKAAVWGDEVFYVNEKDKKPLLTKDLTWGNDNWLIHKPSNALLIDKDRKGWYVSDGSDGAAPLLKGHARYTLLMDKEDEAKGLDRGFYFGSGAHPELSDLSGYQRRTNRSQIDDLDGMGGLVDVDDDLSGLVDVDDDLSGLVDVDDDLSGLVDVDDDLSGLVDVDDSMSGLVDVDDMLAHDGMSGLVEMDDPLSY